MTKREYSNQEESLEEAQSELRLRQAGCATLALQKFQDEEFQKKVAEMQASQT